MPSFDLLYSNLSIVEQDYEAVKKAALHIHKLTRDSWPDETFSFDDDLEELRYMNKFTYQIAYVPFEISRYD